MMKRLIPKQNRNRLEALMRTAIDTNGAFTIVPPPELRKKGNLVFDTDDAIRRLVPTMWDVKFRDGSTTLLLFTDLMVFLYNFRELNRQLEELDKSGLNETTAIKVITTRDPAVALKVEVVQAVFGRLGVVRG